MSPPAHDTHTQTEGRGAQEGREQEQQQRRGRGGAGGAAGRLAEVDGRGGNFVII